MNQSTPQSKLDALDKQILSLIAASPRYGITTYALWLNGSKAKSLQTKKLNRDYYGIAADHTQVELIAKIDNLLMNRYLNIEYVGTHDLPVLQISKIAKQILQSAGLYTEESSYKKGSNSDERFLKKIESGDRQAWIDFLHAPNTLHHITHCKLHKIHELSRLLTSKMPGWEMMVRLYLFLDPQKYRPLERLLKKAPAQT